LDEIDEKLLAQIIKGIALTPEPFREIARELGITQKEVVSRLTELKKEGIIRKFGASIKPNNIGYSANALVAWKVPADRIKEVGSQLSEHQDISHCYERKPVQGKWEYNLYTVMHARERENIQSMVNQISAEMAINEYKILYSTRDLKRTITSPSRPNSVQFQAFIQSTQNLSEMDKV
jgi:siroheme decarboxylase